MKTLAIIPARGGSRGVVRKNMRMLCDKPLLYWTIAAAQLSHVDGIVVSSEDNDILTYADEFREVVPLRRPAELATDTATTDSVLLHVLEEVDPHRMYDAVVTLQPTSPVRPPGLIDECVRQLADNAYLSCLLTLTEGPTFTWRIDTKRDVARVHSTALESRVRRQDIAVEDRVRTENGSVYVTRTKTLREYSARLAENIGYYLMDPEDSIEIDTEYDLWLAAQRMGYLTRSPVLAADNDYTQEGAWPV